MRKQWIFPAVWALLLGTQAGPLAAQQDSPTPAAEAPGNPASSHGQSLIDNINYYNGNLNISIPLYTIGGRGDAGETITLGIAHQWTLDEVYSPIVPMNLNWLGYTFGTISLAMASNVTSCDQGTGSAYTYVVWTKPDRTQVYLADTTTNGQAEPVAVDSTTCNITGTVSRGTVFRSYDGSDITFTAASTVYDGMSAVAGVLALPNGTQYHFDPAIAAGSFIPRINDRNGNQIIYQYHGTTNGVEFDVTDSAGRAETFNVTENIGSDPGYSSQPYDTITYPGPHSGTEQVKVNYDWLHNLLAPGQTQKTPQCLFPGTAGSSSTPWDEGVVSSVVLPDGSSYSFLYDSYGEVSQVKLPTGGVYQYVWPAAASCTNATGDGLQGNGTIYRRVLERDELPGGVGTTPTLRTIFSPTPTTSTGPEGTSIPSTDVTVKFENSDGTMLFRQEVHHYWGDPTNADAVPSGPLAYPSWTDGVETGSSVIGTNGTTVLSTVQNTWQQRPCLSSETCWISDLSAATARLNDPRICQTTTTLSSGSSGTELFYDGTVPWNRQTDLFEFEYGSAPSAGCPSSLPTSGFVRHTNTAYSNDPTHIAPGVNLTQLPSQRTVYGMSGTTVYQAAQENWTYDEAGTLTGASGLASESHDDTDYGTGTTARGDVTTHTVWENEPSSVTYPENFTWDTAGAMVSHTDFNRKTTSYAYTDGAHVAPTSVTLPSTGSYTPNPLTFSYDQGTQQPTLATDENGIATAYSYDALNRPLSVVRAQGKPSESWTQYGYLCISGGTPGTCSSGVAPNDFQVKQDQTTKGAGEILTETVIDGLGRTVQTHQYENSGYITTVTTYDGLGRTATVTNPYRSGDTVEYTTYGYDAMSRPTSIAAPDGTTVNAVYTGNQAQVTIPAGSNASPESIVKASLTDAEGRMISMTVGGLTTTYGYDALNDLSSVSQSGQSRTFSYDSRGQLYSVVNPENGTTGYTYDGNSNLTKRTNNRGVQTTYSWDARNRLSSVTYSGTPSAPNVTYNYDTGASFAGGRLVSVVNSVATNQVTSYDELGRITGSSVAIGSGTPYLFYYGYNRADSLISEQYPSGRLVTTEYDLANRPNCLLGGSPTEPNCAVETGITRYVSGLTYAAHGAPAAFTYGNGLARTQSYTSLLEPNEMTDQLGAGTNALLDLLYGWSDAGRNVGNPASVVVQTRPTPSGTLLGYTQNFTYNSTNQLATANENTSTWTQSFSYDNWGNMSGTQSGFTGTSVPALPVSGTYDTTTNRRNSGSGFGSYDSGGNQLTPGASNGVSYDAENRVTGATDTASNTYQYGFDGLGQRVSVVENSSATTAWVHDAFGNLAAQYTSGTLAPPCTTCYVSWDHLGSTRMVTDQNGAVVSRHDYLPFGYEIPSGVDGRTSAWGATDYLTAHFVSTEHDSETVLDYMNARHFSAMQGRFTQADPANAGADAGNPQSFNMYAYALNNPMTFVDPSGLCTVVNGQYQEDEGPACPNNTYSVSVTSSADGWPTLPTSVPPGACLQIILDGVAQANECGQGQTVFTVTATTPKTPQASQTPSSNSLGVVLKYLLRKPWVASWIVPILGVPGEAGFGPAGSVAWNPATHNLCASVGGGVSVGHNFAVGPLTNSYTASGKPASGKEIDNILSGWSISGGANIPSPLGLGPGIQGTVNGSGAALGPTWGSPGLSVAVTTAACVKLW